MKNIALAILLLVVNWASLAQEPENGAIEQFIAEMLEEYAAESDEEPDIESMYDELIALAAQPLQLNSANRDQLIRLPFLSELQVENILYHRYTYGAFTSLYELQLVEGLDMTDIRRMLPFIRLGIAAGENEPLHWWELKKYGKHELYLRSDYIPEIKKGYRQKEGVPAVYAGDRFHTSLKYRFDFRDRIRVNITAEKDAGERWWNNRGSGIDFLSASLQLRSVGKIENLIVGDFLAGFGQGLVIRQGFNRSKSSMTTRVMHSGNGFKRYASTNEHQFFRGIAGSMYSGVFGVHAFLSHRNLDATFDNDVFRSVYTTGYHRTASEMDKIDRVTQQTAGLCVTYKQLHYEIGLSSVYTQFSSPLQPECKPYNLFYFRGSRQLSSGLHYRFRWNGFQFFGETALTGHANAATVNGFTISPASRVSMALVHRYYPGNYNPLFAGSFSTQSRITNENGLYFGVEVYPAARWKLSAYADSYRFSWLKFGVDAPSFGNDFLLQLGYSPTRRLQISLRGRYKHQYTSLRTAANPVAVISPSQKWSGRLQLDYSIHTVQFRNSIELNYIHSCAGESADQEPLHDLTTQLPGESIGYGAWQDVTTQVPGVPLKVSFRYLMFNIPAYANRIYTYEKDVLHAFSSPSFSGKGSRCYLMLQYTASSRISCWLKLAQVHYADGRPTIGSGNEEISGNKRTEFHFLLRLRTR